MPYDEKLVARLDEIITEALAQEFEYAQGLATDEPYSDDVVRRILAAIDASGTHLIAQRCQPRWGSCALPAGHYGQHNAHALTEREKTECASSPS